ncbi:hypothetical protein ANCDUO_02906 [Ancylostoma duodenale]|uniref:Reverse transcriptase domain-containing protein n=1 Tax=Ancylostoma duodenale TaxID=51022 RepID=A0A0C2DV82_9BILA|nr:hypothetical protein ANCDUO_02906 [Ancylostoma duodenale]
MLLNLRFTDNVVLIGNNTAEMDQLLNELNEVGKVIGPETTMKETQMMAKQRWDNRTAQLD